MTYCLAAQCLLGLGQWPRCIEAARAAIALDPRSEWAYRLAAAALAEQERYPEARHYADQAVRLAPNQWQTHQQRAAIDADADEVDELSEAAARRAVELGPDQPSAHMTLGVVELRRKRYKTAAASFRQVLALEPDNPGARNNLAITQLRRRRFISAASHFVGALRLSPDSPLFARNLRLTLHRLAVIVMTVAVLFCVIAGALLQDRTVSLATVPRRIPLTIAPGRVMHITAPIATSRHVPVVGHPMTLIIGAAVFDAAILLVALTLRRSIGPSFGRVMWSFMSRDRLFALRVVTTVVVVVAFTAAAAVGMPTAQPIAAVTLSYVFGAAIASRILTPNRRRWTPLGKRR